MLATGPAGYHSLCRLSSLIQGSPEREMLAVRGLSWEEIRAHREGLICLSGGKRGWIERYLRAGDTAAAQIYAGRLAGAFDDRAYLSLEIRTEADRPIALRWPRSADGWACPPSPCSRSTVWRPKMLAG